MHAEKLSFKVTPEDSIRLELSVGSTGDVVGLEEVTVQNEPYAGSGRSRARRAVRYSAILPRIKVPLEPFRSCPFGGRP